MKDFKDKVAVVTGAASGIGFGLAEKCAKEGMKVVLAGINEDTLKKAEKAIKKTEATTLVVKCDVSKAKDVEALAKETLEAFGAVHLLFNNAGIGIYSTVWETTLADWEWDLGVKLWGVIHGIHFFVPIMIKQGTECHVVNTSGVGGLVSSPYSPYAVANHGVTALSEILYRELAQKGYNIGVSVLCPGFVKTRTMDSERNRPAELRNRLGKAPIDPVIQSTLELFRRGVANGMLPSIVADITFNAIKDHKFYILPNAEFAMPMIQTRIEDILHQRNPTPFPDMK